MDVDYITNILVLGGVAFYFCMILWLVQKLSNFLESRKAKKNAPPKYDIEYLFDKIKSEFREESIEQYLIGNIEEMGDANLHDYHKLLQHLLSKEQLMSFPLHLYSIAYILIHINHDTNKALEYINKGFGMDRVKRFHGDKGNAIQFFDELSYKRFFSYPVIKDNLFITISRKFYENTNR